MIKILNHVQVLDHLHQYVPTHSVEVPVDAPGAPSMMATDDTFHHILFGKFLCPCMCGYDLLVLHTQVVIR